MSTKNKISIIEDILEDMINGTFLIDLLNNVDREDIEEKLIKIADSIIDDYYKDGKRTVYDPTHSLYKAYKINDNNDIESDPSLITDDPSLIPDTHRVGPEYIYEHMFLEGWHGGAAELGYKIPYDYKRNLYDGDENYPYKEKRKLYWKTAEQFDDSPKEKIDMDTEKYIENNAEKYIKKAWDKTISKYGL